jgi:hypothetical protein
MKYRVTVVRIEQREHTFEVEATSPWTAEDAGLEEASNYDFRQNHASSVKNIVTTVI